ncbi:MAG TPA: dihydrodipicolinate synthase family protein [Caldilineaceae bacterium]|nr:dihydrodipicolinate synthase family protein [Caldilineaceae bacterium]
MAAFSGAWPALVTPFTRDDRVNAPALRGVVDYLVAKGIGGFYVCGSTGEGVYMTVEERKLVAETTIEQAAGRVPVIVHVGSMALPDAAALARHAQAAGANAIASIIPPHYNSVASIVEYFSALSAAAPELPLLAYIFGGPADAVALMRALMPIPTVAGSKYTGPNMHEFRQIVDLGREYRGPHGWTVFSGMDEECFFAALFGASGNIGSTLNYIPGVYREIHQARAQGDMARGTELQLQANEITRILFDFGFMGALKEVMCLLGHDCGRPRLPNRPFDEARRGELHAQLQAAGFDALAAL